MRKRPLFLGACVFLAGMALERYKAPELLAVLLYVLGVEIFHGQQTKALKTLAGRSLVLLSAFFLGACHMYQQESFRERYLSKIADGEEAIVWGEISKIETTDYGIRLLLSDCYIYLEDEAVPCNHVMVYTSSSDYKVGQIHKISGQINKFTKARNQGNFDSEVFYQSQKIDFAIHATNSVCLQNQLNWLDNALVYLKDQLIQVYSHCLSSEAAGFYAGMILGDRSKIEEDLKNLFTDGGIVHILAVSGLHMSIVGRSFYQFLRKRGLRFFSAGIAGAMTVLMYCNMTGGGMSALRAVGMLLLYFVAQCLGKSYDTLNALGGVVFVLLWENPFWLEYSGFWFSVMAFVGIGFLTEPFSKGTKYSASFWSSLGITLATMPITAFCYYEIPLYAALVNAIVLPILTPVFGLAILGGFLGIVLPGVAQVVLLPCQWAFYLFENVCAISRQLPGAMLVTGEPERESILLYYGLLLLGLLLLKEVWKKIETDGKKNRGQVLRFHVGKILLYCVCLMVLLFPKYRETEITCLDVGQGDGIYLCMSDGTQMFIDGGSTDASQVGRYRILPFLKSKQVSTIDYWFVTHADTDHISGLLEVLESGFEIRYLVVAEAVPRDENFEALVVRAAQNGVKMLHMKELEYIEGNNWVIKCLYPGTEKIEDKNEASLVLSLTVDGYRALFTGDISSEVEQKLIASGVLEDIFFYKAAHHGSKYSNSMDFLKLLSPEVCVISCGEGNLYGHPHIEVLERMGAIDCEIYTTMDGGQISIIIEKETEVSVYISPQSLIQ